TGYFWHVSDFHVDKQYEAGGSRDLFCHRDVNASTMDNTGPYGDFSCDTPELLAQSAIEVMERIKSEVDFVLWTGDNVAHGKWPTWTDVYSHTHWIASLLWHKMGRNQSLIVPTLGNRDWVPANAMRSMDAAAYRGFIISGGFKQLLPEEVWGDFERGGYYSLQLSKNIRLVCLNTVLWYTLNNGGRSRSRGDPQLEWLREQLHDAQRHGQKVLYLAEKVFISGHIGPGFFLRSLPGEPANILFFDDVNDGYQDLISDYKDVVAGQFFGHQHEHAFVLLSDKAAICSELLFFLENRGLTNAGTPVSCAHLTGSVTPYGSSHPLHKFTSVSVNPSLRLYSYRRSNGMLLDYTVYYLDLQKANMAAASKVLQLVIGHVSRTKWSTLKLQSSSKC
ncbi:cyclic GMP-AMP phosphodiesterase SMPDL3A, partial [Rhipicephalus microplus]|uniref:cyclic GMP-AMP phosphodiesterase SMPDL3A n=1 Tax=Rhipicephalus microplus TaxID=6941 RepID=UPI003F6BCD03